MSETGTESPTPTDTYTLTQPPTITDTATAGGTATASLTPTPEITDTITASETATASPTFTPTVHSTITFTATFTRTETNAPTDTPVFSATPTFTATLTGSETPEATAPHTATPTPTSTPIDFFEKDTYEVTKAYVYPNPSFGKFMFVFEVNKPSKKVEIKIFTCGRRLVRVIEYYGFTAGRHERLTEELRGLDNGVYHFMVKCHDGKGNTAHKTGEIVILK